jgi:hypothetical protein
MLRGEDRDVADAFNGAWVEVLRASLPDAFRVTTRVLHWATAMQKKTRFARWVALKRSPYNAEARSTVSR